MSKINHKDDLDLLLSLDDRVLETPPASPSAHSPGYLSDDGSSRRRRQADMSVFRDAVQDCLDYDTQTAKEATKSRINKHSSDAQVEKFSGLRIRNQVVSPVELSNRIADIRFVRLPAIKNLLKGDTLNGCWATIGVLTEKGSPRTSSTGKTYAIWKMGCLDEKTISIFLFGDAYLRNCDSNPGTVFALFNCSVRNDKSEHGFSLSVYSANHILKLGTSVDYGVCKGKRKDGLACTLFINKRRGAYCSYHNQRTSEKYSVTRTELKGGNLRTAFNNPYKPEGVYMVNPLGNQNSKKSTRPQKIFSVDGLKRALSNAGKVTTNTYSQGIRFLTEITGKRDLESKTKLSTQPQHSLNNSGKRSFSSHVTPSKEPCAKRTKAEQVQPQAEKEKQVGPKMIELEIVSSDDEV